MKKSSYYLVVSVLMALCGIITFISGIFLLCDSERLKATGVLFLIASLLFICIFGFNFGAFIRERKRERADRFVAFALNCLKEMIEAQKESEFEEPFEEFSTRGKEIEN